MESNSMAHYIDDDIITSHHLLAPKMTTVRSRGNTMGLTKRKVAQIVEEPPLKEEQLPEPPKLPVDVKARREAIRARYVKNSSKRRLPLSPFGMKPGKDLQLGWTNVPFVSRILVSGVLLTILSLTTPFWAYVRSYSVDHASFGLWHFCIGADCWSIHDNLIHGRDVPLWYMISQMTFTIGVICATLAMFVVTSNHVNGQVKLSPTTNSTMVMMLVIGVLQMSTGLYTFISYFEDVSFMYEYSEDVEEVDLYGSYWMGVIGTALIFLAAMILFFDEVIMPYPNQAMYFNRYGPNSGFFPPGYLPPGYYPLPGDPPFSTPGSPDSAWTPKSPGSPMSPWSPGLPMSPGSPDSYSSYPPDGGYPYSPDFIPGEFPPPYTSGEFPPDYTFDDDYPAPGTYPDNALFSDMDEWDNCNWTPIVSQQDIPYADNPATANPRPKTSFVEDYLKKST